MRKINFVTTGRVWAIVLAFGVAVLVASGSAMAQSGSKAVEDDMAKHKATMMDASKKMIEGANMVREAMKMMEEKKDVDKAQQMMSDAAKMMKQGEEMMQGGMMMKKEKKDAPEADKAINEGHKHVEEGAKKMIEPESTEKAK